MKTSLFLKKNMLSYDCREEILLSIDWQEGMLLKKESHLPVIH